MTTFGLSIFPSPEHLIAFSVSMLTLKEQSSNYLQSMMKRTKNPPISVIYTAKFLRTKSAEQYGLDIIRFISQLSDLSSPDTNTSQGSMLRSLKNVIDESSFLIEVRHNLTHKNMIQREVIDISRSIILKNLYEKYWRQLIDKVIHLYNLQTQDIETAYQHIYCRQMEESDKKVLFNELQNRNNEIDEEWLISKCSNYEFKEFFPKFCEKYHKNKIVNAFSEISSHKWAIAVNYLLRLFISSRRNQQQLDLVVHLLRLKSDRILEQELVLKKLRQISFTHYLGLSRKLLSSLPENVQDYLQKYWQQKSQIKQIYCQYTKKINKKQNEKCDPEVIAQLK